MTWQFAFLNLFIISAGTILVLVIRTLPRLDDEPVARNVIERWLTSEFPAKMDLFFHGFYIRTLRRFKVMIMKTDNALNKKMERMKLRSDDALGGKRVDIRSMTGKSVEEVGEETGVE
jgi:hypothetical protein